jgi:hypothetical protein
MKTYYFVGGPRAGEEATFFARLESLGGVPHGWRIYRHAGTEGRALHLVESESEAPILAHLAHFDLIYDRGPIVEVVQRPEGGGGR